MSDVPVENASPYTDAAIRAAQAGGEAIMDVYGSVRSYQTKDDDSPVTEADLRSNDAIKSVLSGTGLPILSEEDTDSGERLAAETVWIVDPLDGTSDFIDRTGEFTVMVALVTGGRPVVGVIGWPAGDTLYVAQAGDGSWMRDAAGWARMEVSRTAETSGCTAVTSRHHLTEREGGFLESLGVRDRRALGSSLKVAQIGSGRADIYITFTDRMKEWDTAASHCIIHEAGGRMTDVSGNELSYNRPDVYHRNGILVTNGTVHDRILAELGRLK